MMCRRLFTLLPMFGLADSARHSSASSTPTHVSNVLNGPLTLKLAGYVNAVTWDRNGLRLAALSDFGGMVTVWNGRDWEVVDSFSRYGGSYSQNSFSFLSDGTLLTSAPTGRSPDPRYSTLEVFSLVQWDPATGKPIRYIPDLESLSIDLRSSVSASETFAVSMDGLLVAAISKGYILLFETASWSVLMKLQIPPTPQHPDFPASVSVSPDGLNIAVGTGFGYVHIFDAKRGVILKSFLAFPGGFGFRCGAISYSPDGQLLVTGRAGVSAKETDSGWVRIWNASQGTLVERLSESRASIRSVAWNRDGTALAVGDDKALRVWDMRAVDRPPQLLINQSGSFYSVAFSSANTLAASSAKEVMIFR